MSSEAGTAIDNRALMEMPLTEAIEAYAPNFAAVLPPNVSVAHFKRMVVLAISTNPDLWKADRRTLFNACVKCASDGLLPDGREAALVVYRTKIKDRQGQERYIDAAQYLPMVAGIRKRMRNSGDVISATAEVVYKNDHFRYRKGDDGGIEHEPAPLEAEPGQPIGAYAIIRLANGETIREVMRLHEIERVRSFSRAKDGPAWKNWWTEMARKSALRRASKAVPQSALLERLLVRDEEAPELPAPETMALVPPRPSREDFEEPPVAAETEEIALVEDEADDELPTHVMQREEPEDEPDFEEVERNPFWSQKVLFAAPVRNGTRTDWPATRELILMLIRQAETIDELHRLAHDSERTIDGIRLAEKSTVVSTALGAREAELRRVTRDAAGLLLTPADMGN